MHLKNMYHSVLTIPKKLNKIMKELLVFLFLSPNAPESILKRSFDPCTPTQAVVSRMPLKSKLELYLGCCKVDNRTAYSRNQLMSVLQPYLRDEDVR